MTAGTTSSIRSRRFSLWPVPHTAITFRDGFWGPRLKLNRERTLPAIQEQLEHLGRFEAVRLAWGSGQQPEPEYLWTTDLTEWIEVASYHLAVQRDPDLEALVDKVVHYIALSQQPDGYLDQRVHPTSVEERWRDLRDCHRLYAAGHLFEAAVAYFHATGKRDLLELACRYADHIDQVFGRGEGQIRGYDGHEEIELALVKLYRATGEKRYLRLASYFVDERGQPPNFFEQEPGSHAADEYFQRQGLPWRAEYNQSHLPVREQTEVVGHAVRAMYLYCAMADLAVELGDESLLHACRRLWEHLTSKRLYVIGGLGSTYRNEGMTEDHDLPNEAAYCETCAACGLVFWNYRLLHAELDGRYADLMERALYNNVAAGISLDGSRFFYDNKLATVGDHHRTEWFEVACCPPNVARLLASLGEYVYSQGDAEIVVHLYARSDAMLDLAGERVTLHQETDYPWDGTIRITVEPEHDMDFVLRLRVPGWCRRAALSVNDEVLQCAPTRGYVSINRTWKTGDEVVLHLEMSVERVRAHPQVRADAGRVALQRGPIVYCIESVDNGSNLEAFSLAKDAPIDATFRQELLGGVVTLQARGERADEHSWGRALYSVEVQDRAEVELTAVPYATWDNRDPGEMLVWVRER